MHLQARNDHPNIHVASFNSLAHQITPSEKTEADERFKEEEAGLLQYLEANGSLPYAHLIVDEAQDFESEWLEHLYLCFSDKTFYVFYDRNQLVRQGDLAWLDANGCRLVLTLNCRNTFEIARVAYRAAGLTDPFPAIRGPRPVLYTVESDREAAELTQQLFQAAREERHVEPDEVAILTMDAVPTRGPLEGMLFANSEPSDEPAAGRVTMMTARRFKGLEASFVVVSDVDFRLADDPEWRRNLYVACSRARQAAHIITTVSEKELTTAVRAFARNEKVRPSWKALSKHLGVALRLPGSPVSIFP